MAATVLTAGILVFVGPRLGGTSVQDGTPRALLYARRAFTAVTLVLVCTFSRYTHSVCGDGHFESFVFGVVLVTLLGTGLVVRGVYEAWRVRRNARLAAEWERRFQASERTR